MNELIKVENLSKSFKLSAKQQKIEKTNEKIRRAVAGLSFSAYEGEIFGLLGPNGAGKTTTLRLLATLIKPDGGDALTRYRMFTVLSTYVEQAAYASFEYSAYMLPPGEVTAENILALYEKTGTEFGFDSWGWDPRDLVAITHFYMVPMYVSSYVLSNDAALQIYQLELEESGAGAALLEQQLNTQESYFLAFLEAAGLESPFAEGRMEAVRSTLRAALQ